MSIWQTIITALGGTALLLGAVAWMVKKIVVHFLDKDVEAYKVKLQADADRQLEAFKTELRLIEFRSTKLHDKRAEAVAEIYRRLANLQSAMKDYIWTFDDNLDVEHSRSVQGRKLTDARDNFFSCYDSNRILLDDDICEKLDAYNKNVLGIFNRYSLTVSFVSDGTEAQHQAIRQALNDMKKLADPIRKDLTNEFRHILRGEDDPGKS
jgi:hypothetical protein